MTSFLSASSCSRVPRTFALLCSLLLGAGLASCRSTNRLDIGYDPPPADKVGRGVEVHVAPVIDARDVKPRNLGVLAHGTALEAEKDEKSLARALGSGLRDELAALGFRRARDERQVQLAVTILEWKWTEDGKDSEFRCALDVAVLEPLASRVRDRARVTYERYVEGSTLSGSWAALNEAHPEVFAEVIQMCLRRNRVVLEALSATR